MADPESCMVLGSQKQVEGTEAALYCGASACAVSCRHWLSPQHPTDFKQDLHLATSKHSPTHRDTPRTQIYTGKRCHVRPRRSVTEGGVCPNEGWRVERKERGKKDDALRCVSSLSPPLSICVCVCVWRRAGGCSRYFHWNQWLLQGSCRWLMYAQLCYKHTH